MEIMDFKAGFGGGGKKVQGHLGSFKGHMRSCTPSEGCEESEVGKWEIMRQERREEDSG